ncbi:MAG: YcbK family protein [Phenylobacterium sp.]|uniref:YcbK family protein n=1 Tax=Phenylobacterium sp. TaxID=1871053 RepID=UPI0025D30C18|nr:YcbK family protein [Phenylobacterium sp.]MCG9916080.1 YcbK family protein [Phenylobacterium sp.]
MSLNRRALIGAALALPLASPALASSLTPRRLSVLNLHTGERLATTYWEAGSYVPEALSGLARVLRDHRTGETHAMAPQLLDLVARLQSDLGASQPVQVISGYRSPRTNEALRRSGGGGVAKRSLHMDGLAMDIRLPGIDLARLRDAAWAQQGGGVGYYPGSDFVHVDVGAVRRWNG